MSHPKQLVIRDEIHGDMTFENLTEAAIDHPYFQRLRNIKQLGLAEYVFPCATHTRFQHSLGACYLAGRYFDHILDTWTKEPLAFEGKEGKTTLFVDDTRRAVESVAADPASKKYWREAISLAALLHDVGHGPWSHTFEYLELEHDFQKDIERIPGTAGLYLAGNFKTNRRLKHEDLSLIYLFHILTDLEQEGRLENKECLFATVSSLIHNKLSEGTLGKNLETELDVTLGKAGLKGGKIFHRLLRPLISGPFDVDRIDYIQRDGQNCGVHIAGIEWRRIMSKVIPCSADHYSAGGDEPRDVVLVSSIKNQHILDDFVFTLFQMYAQVYMHPKIVGFEEMIKIRIANRKAEARRTRITFEQHSQWSDESFRRFLVEKLELPDIEGILLRRPEFKFEVQRYPEEAGMADELRHNGFRVLSQLDRPMLKDSVGVFLYSSLRDENGQRIFLRPWQRISEVAAKFSAINYSPNLWVREPESGH